MKMEQLELFIEPFNPVRNKNAMNHRVRIGGWYQASDVGYISR